MNPDKQIFNKKKLQPYRKALRNNLTSAEVSLWNLLKNKQLSGRKFRRQHSIGNYIVDFYCPEEMLIIELDGDAHGEYNQITKDECRDNYLNNLGFIIIRFENKLVFKDPEFVINEIIKNFSDKQ
ncbi:MAG: endonuclease domain-containing protein [Bacteroidetes bacterium]|nr:endonuclease domain-containing protein [Bacteroidota bacterium]